nr:hypothetical protein [uncultured Enterobacter sp.]
MVKKILSALVCVVLAGCSGKDLKGSSEIEQKEYIYTQLNDYPNLIDIYRNKLRENDNDEDRFKLADLYYKVEDYSSSNIYLQPLVERNKKEEYLLLQARNYLELGDEKSCESILDQLALKNPTSGEIWNLYGVLFAQKGHYDKSQQAFEKARGLFYNEEIVMNNLAMLAMLKNDFVTAKNYLLPLYSRKQFKRQTVYNLVYALAKTNDTESARKIIAEEKLFSGDPDKVIRSLQALTPRDQQKQSEIIVQKHEKISADEKVPAEKMLAVSEPLPTQAETKSTVDVSSDVNQSNNCQVTASGTAQPKAFQGKTSAVKKIASLTSAQDESSDRIALYSSYPINYHVMPTSVKNQFIVELINTYPLKDIYTAQLNILKKMPRLHNIEFINDGNNNTQLKIEMVSCNPVFKIERVSANGKAKEKILISVNY